MDKNIIKKFAVQARRDLIEQIMNEANSLGIDEKGALSELPSSTNDIKFYRDDSDIGLTGRKIRWRSELVKLLNSRSKKSDWQTAFKDTVEEVAYTWFNRIIAIRFMEVNDYLPSRVRVLSSEEGRAEPDIIFYAQDEDLIEELGKYSPEEEKLVNKAKTTGHAYDMDQMYQMLFNKQVDALNKILPGLFEKTSDYMKLLFTPKYNSGVIKNLIDEVPEEYFDVEKEGQVEIIGWLYQYYNTEPHDKVVNITGGAVQKRDIPAATQLFTTDWVVRYMVDNSLGKYYLERHPESNAAQKLDFLLPEKIDAIDDNQDLTAYSFIDNAMGSGHILVYAFDVFMIFYEEQGYSSREAAKLILENNLYGMDIDRRAYQLSYFALMMKFRQYDRRAFSRDTKPNLYCFEDTDDISDAFFDDLCAKNSELGMQTKELVSLFADASEIGAILKVPQVTNIDQLLSFVQRHQVNDDLGVYNLIQEKGKVIRVLELAKQLTRKYDVSVTNPPYMNKFDTNFKKYLKQNYKSYSKDLFSVFIYHNSNIITTNGYAAFMTPFVWMFIKSYEELRTYLLDNKKISSLIQLEYSAFEEATVPINTFVIKNTRNNDNNGVYLRLSDFKGGMEIQKQKVLEAIEDPDCKYLYRSNQTKFQKLPSNSIIYWLNNKVIKIFSNSTLADYGDARLGMATALNALFMRFWFEVSLENSDFSNPPKSKALHSSKKWFLYDKGGEYRKWYGNNLYVVNWQNNGSEIRNFQDSKGKIKSHNYNLDYIFRPGITWNALSSGKFSSRFTTAGHLFDNAGSKFFSKDDNLEDLLGIQALFSSKVSSYLLKALNPTINYQPGTIAKLPVVKDFNSPKIKTFSKDSINNSFNDWNAFELSYSFSKHPFLFNIAEHKQNWTIEAAYAQWEKESLDRFNQLKSNEEELNKIFIDLYGLQDELTPEEDDKDVSVRKADKERDVKSFLSYFIGCVFGRYSLDSEGLAFAGGEWDSSKYHSFVPNEDNVIVLTDEDYFGDQRDIINRLKEFLTVTFGQKNLYQNLDFIASVLDQKKLDKGIESQQIIRDYFSNDFFKKDHLKIYQKRPIYWELNSGKAKGFKALIYQHRYSANTMAMIRSEYLHELQDAYENSLKFKERQRDNETDKKMIKIFEKEITNLNKKITELVKFDQELQHVASQQIEIDLDDGVVVNHKKVQADTKILTPIK